MLQTPAQPSLLAPLAHAELLCALTAYYRCRQLEGFEVEVDDQDDGQTYTVTYRDYRFSCTCRESRKHHRVCCHIRRADRERCCWDQGVHGGTPETMECDSDQYCPRCGDVARVTLWAV